MVNKTNIPYRGHYNYQVHNSFINNNDYIIIIVIGLVIIGYLIILPQDNIGYYLLLLMLLITITKISIKSLGLFCLLLGPIAFGGIFRSFGIQYLGTVVAIFIGMATIVTSRKWEGIPPLKWHSIVLIWVCLVITTLFIFYIRGPQTEYATTKLVGFTQNIILTMIALHFLFINPRINIWEIGILAIIAGSCTYAAILFSYPSLIPDNILDTAHIRIASQAEDIRVISSSVALVTSIGVVFAISAIVDGKYNNHGLVVTFLFIMIGVLILNSIGQRLFLVVPIISTVSLILSKPRNKKLLIIIIIALTSVLSIMIIVSIAKSNPIITNMVDDTANLAERVNRSANWISAINRIEEKPYLGHGLGGYYVDGYSYPGDATYAHNIILELLSEIGIIGAFIILFPVILFIYRNKYYLFTVRTARGQLLFPYIILVFIHSMISHDLSKSAVLFGIFATLWTYKKSITNNYNKKLTLRNK
jgi:O-antigen ligase